LVYKKKVAVLSALIAVLAIVYICTLVFDPQNSRSSAFAWLESGQLDMADRMEIYGTNGKIELRRRNNVWFFVTGTEDLTGENFLVSPGVDESRRMLPVKQNRVADLFSLLSRKSVYPLRAVSAEGSERLGLTGEGSSRIIVHGGAGLPLLDLLIGGGDALGREVYLKRSGKNEIYSGEDDFSFFIESRPASWYDLRLFAEDGRSYGVEAVQQAEITLPWGTPFILRRGGRGWIVQGDESASSSLDVTRVDSWLRSTLEAEGDDFGAEAPETIEGNITLRFGDGRTQTLLVGAVDENRKRSATVSTSALIYTIGEWTFNNLFRDNSYFLNTAQ
jgi:hypothetical protein